MKTLFLASCALFLSSIVQAIDVWNSSTTATSSNSVNVLCTETQRGIFHGVCTNFGVAAASMTVVNSTFTTTGVKLIGPISTFVADQCKYYDAAFPSGMGYYKTNTANVTILYQCY